MRCLIFLVLSFAAIYANENRYYCLYIRPNIELTVTSASLEWGKWIAKAGDSQEISSPVGKVAPANGELIICSTGRKMAASGTTGNVVLSSAAGKNVKIWWSAAWGGKLDHGSEQKSNEFDVTVSPNGYQQWIWNIVAK